MTTSEDCQRPEEQKVCTAADEATPSTVANSPASGDASVCSTSCATGAKGGAEEAQMPQQLQAGLFDDDDDDDEDTTPRDSEESATEPCQPIVPSSTSACNDAAEAASKAKAPQPSEKAEAAAAGEKFEKRETFFIFDWDDTVLPSTWVQRQGLRLDSSSVVTSEQRQVLAEVAAVTGRTLRAARQYGTVILVTNAERGWIELSCQKFLPTLMPMLENVKIVSARTSYEMAGCKAPREWKLRAFEAEMTAFFGLETIFDEAQRKNTLSLGDSVHEREALLRATASLPNCRAKSLKFVERPDVRQILKQHELITGSLNQIVHHDGHLDLSIQCPP